MMGPSAIGAQPPPDDLDEEWLMIQEDEERTEMHTQEPWMVDPDNRPGYEWNNHIVSATDTNQTICFMTHDNTAENIEGEANARRIVACVNACKGIKTESLEMEVLSWITDETGENPLQRERDELLEARRACGERLIEVEQQRDELRAELHRIATADPSKWEPDVRDQFQQWAQNRARYALEKSALAGRQKMKPYNA